LGTEDKTKRRKTMKLSKIGFGLALTATIFTTTVNADTLQSAKKKTTVTTTHSLEIPGQVLPAGKYVFQLVDTQGSRNVVRITNEDETKAVAMFIAIPNYRLQATGEPVLEFHERPSGSPPAIRAWFFAREKAGLEFVYPKAKAVELAEASNEVVPAELEQPANNNVTTLRRVVVMAITPQGAEKPVEEAIETTPEIAQTLPRTASPLPLIALLGSLFTAAGVGLKQLAKQRS
jgi:hypothetical protein